MDTNEDKAKQAEVCCDSSSQGDADCCSSGSGSGKSWKTAVFVIVILAAGAVAAHSLLTGNSKTASVPLAVTSSFDTISEQPSKTAAVSCGVTLDSIESLGRIADAQGANVVFIFLAGENEELALSASAQVEAVINKLSAQGKRVSAFTLEKGAEGYDQLIKQFSVELPCVIVAGKGSQAVPVSVEINEARLLGAFVTANTPSSCGPRTGSSCCPR
ncbi:MAG: hypothetical protein ACYSSO_11070 [Planctomycetota bacterium]|jgi:hypothetical protein